MKSYQCQNCKKDFNTQEVYIWGKDNHYFCQSCNEKNKKKCSWCEKDLNCHHGNSGREICHLHNHERERKIDGGDSSEYKYEAFCDEKCRSEFNKYQENTPERIVEKEKLLNKGWKKCGKSLISFEPAKIDCGNLILPTEKYCETCKKNEQEREKRQKAEKELAERKKEYEKKYQQAQNWWNSLSEEEKKKQIKELGEKWQKENWYSRSFNNDGNSLEFKDGKIHYDNWSEVPPPFLEKFGIGCDYSEYISKGSMFVSQSSLSEKINNLISKLQNAKKSGNKTEIDNLEREIRDLKDQQEKGKKPTSEKSPDLSQKNYSCWPWVVIGISAVSLIITIGILILKKPRKRKKVCKRKN